MDPDGESKGESKDESKQNFCASSGTTVASDNSNYDNNGDSDNDDEGGVCLEMADRVGGSSGLDTQTIYLKE